MAHDAIPSDDRDSLLNDFLLESAEHLERLNEKLLAAEDLLKNGQAIPDKDIDTMFRAAHTIKGTASFLAFEKIVTLTHEMETILHQIRGKQRVFTSEIVDVLFEAFDALEALISSIQDDGKEEGDIGPSLARIKTILATQHQTAAKPAVVAEVPAAPKEEEAPAAYVLLDKYTEQFILEAEQHIDTIEEILLRIEKKCTPEDIKELFRGTHTIKGSAGLVNAEHIRDVAHKMENVLSVYRERQMTPDEEIVSLLLDALDAIKAMVNALKEGKAPTMSNPWLQERFAMCSAFLETLRGAPAAAIEVTAVTSLAAAIDLTRLTTEQLACVERAKTEGMAVMVVHFIVQENIPMKGMKALLVTEHMKKKGAVIVQVPDNDTLDACATKESVECAVLYAAPVGVEEVKVMARVDGVDVSKVEVLYERAAQHTTVASERRPSAEQQMPAKKDDTAVDNRSSAGGLATIRVESRKLDHLMNLSGELVIARAGLSRQVSQLSDELSLFKDAVAVTRDSLHMFNQVFTDVRELADAVGDKTGADKTIKEMTDIKTRLEGLEQRFAKSTALMLVHNLDEITGILGKVSSDIQTGVMQSRMVTVDGVFSRFKRIVRDISKELGKEVNLHVSGEDTELDKNIVDRLADPLTHMIRNAMDHGIEDAATRKNANKPPVGTVFLRAMHKGNNICIEVGDDGKGLDANKIAASALKKGLYTQEDLDKMSEKDKYNIIFLPGFSTAEKITDISGRGVGMDVVKNMITSLNGQIDIETQIGHGTIFTMKIPLTLAIIQALLVQVKEEPYAFPLESVVEIIRVPADEIFSVDGNDTVRVRGDALSLVSLHGLLSRGETSAVGEGSRLVVVVTDGDQRLGLVVDALVGEEEIVIKSLTDHFKKVKCISGASVLGDGSIALILDPFSVIAEAK
jgi:two-component system chemotaxis sensor kinase CheA